jgi:hypothetical protein
MASLLAALAVTTWSCGGHVADTSIAPGDRVRVTAPSMDLDKGVGSVTELKTDTLVVEMEERADALDVPLADVTKLEIRGQQTSRATWTGAAIGAAVGGLGLTLAAAAVCSGGACTIEDAGYLAIAAGGAVGGGLVGAGIGALIKTGGWEEVPLDEIRVSLTPIAPGGVGVTVRVRWSP